MQLEGTQTLAADRQQVWKMLNDSDVLKACIPGCEELSGSIEEGFEAVVVQKIGPVKARFRGEVTISDIVEAESYRITGSGKGGAAGFASGGAVVTLADTADGTELSYDVTAQVGGKIAQLGSRLINSFTRKLADQFFERFRQEVEETHPQDA